MTPEMIQNEISRLPNLPYRFSKNDRSFPESVFIMGGQSSEPVDDFPRISRRCWNSFDELIDLSKKEKLSEDDKYRLVSLFSSIKRKCDYSVKGFITRKEQLSYLQKLDENQLTEIEEEINAYKLARSLYKLYSKKPTGNYY